MAEGPQSGQSSGAVTTPGRSLAPRSPGTTFHLAQAAHDINPDMLLWGADRVCKHIERTSVDPTKADILLLNSTVRSTPTPTQWITAR